MEIHIKDDFLEDPEAHRDAVLDCGTFEGQEYEGHFYPGVELCHPLSAIELIEDAVGFSIKPHFAFWRLSKPGEETPHPIHADNSCAKWAGLLYMTPTDEMGGTAFWRNKETGDQELPRRVRMSRSEAAKDYVKKVGKSSADESQWDMTMLVKAKFNRFIAYPSHYFHSRYPFYSENYGDDSESARLIWVIFFDRQP